MEQKKTLTCADCVVIQCHVQNKQYPSFCLTENMDQQIKQEAMAQYQDSQNQNIMITAADIEYEGYGKWPRVQEIIEFAKRMGFHKIGIATCVGLLHETRVFAKILRSHGFEVYGIGCKTGAVPKTEVGIAEKCTKVGKNMCNPILQAKLLNTQKTDMNVVVGLCVGHDSLFYKYAEAMVTTLITKDRVTGHNPAAALYTSEFYYHKLYHEDE